MKVERSGKILCFGEVLLRLSASVGARLSNASSLAVHVGGAEANVGAMLAQLGHDAEMMTVLPNSPLGDLCEAELRRTGLKTDRSVRADGRLGLYFFERGGAGRIIYDRANSAFTHASDQFDWASFCPGTRWFHVSGITLAVGERAERSALAAAQEMHSAGAIVSFDVNHRSSLWEGRPRQDFDCLRKMAQIADVLFASPADISRLLDRELDCDTPEDRRHAAEEAFAVFGGLEVIASTQRLFNGGAQQLSARVDLRDRGHETNAAPLSTIVDRIGSGDAFAGGVIDALLDEASPEDCARKGLAAAVSKHGLAGDHWVGTREELEAFDPFAVSDLRR